MTDDDIIDPTSPLDRQSLLALAADVIDARDRNVGVRFVFRGIVAEAQSVDATLANRYAYVYLDATREDEPMAAAAALGRLVELTRRALDRQTDSPFGCEVETEWVHLGRRIEQAMPEIARELDGWQSDEM